MVSAFSGGSRVQGNWVAQSKLLITGHHFLMILAYRRSIDFRRPDWPNDSSQTLCKKCSTNQRVRLKSIASFPLALDKSTSWQIYAFTALPGRGSSSSGCSLTTRFLIR